MVHYEAASTARWRPLRLADARQWLGRLPFLLAFVGIFGGLAAFGLIGLFVGPVIMAALLAMWREWIFRPEPKA